MYTLLDYNAGKHGWDDALYEPLQRVPVAKLVFEHLVIKKETQLLRHVSHCMHSQHVAIPARGVQVENGLVI